MKKITHIHIILIIGYLLTTQVSFAQQSTKTVYIDTPNLCAKVARIEGNKVFLESDDKPCAQGIGKMPVKVDDTAKEVAVFVNNKRWKTQPVEQMGTDTVYNILENALKDSEKQTVPKNIHAGAGSTKASDSYNYYQSDDFQQKLSSETARLQKELYGGLTSDNNYYKDFKGLTRKGKLSSRERLYVFISSSIPKETLRTYSEMIGKMRDPNVVMVFRGFIGGAKYIKPTASFITSLLVVDPSCNPLKERCETFRTNIIIDPILFSKYNIQQVPAFVYVPVITVNDIQMSEGLESNIQVADHDVIYGAVNLEYVLEALHKENNSKGIEALLAALKEGFYNK